MHYLLNIKIVAINKKMVTMIFQLLYISIVSADNKDIEFEFDSILLPIWLIVVVFYSIFIIINLDDDKEYEICQNVMSKIYQEPKPRSYKALPNS